MMAVATGRSLSPRHQKALQRAFFLLERQNFAARLADYAGQPVAVLEATLAGCALLGYPHTTHVLDDGRRAEIALLAEAWDAQYLTRPEHSHATAGNINHALSRTDAELFAVLDADFAPRKDFLMRTVGFFEDPTIGIVQTPHHFLNVDIYEMNLGLGDHSPNEQRLFFDVILPSRDAWDCAFCCGSASVHGVRMPIQKFGFTLPSTLPISAKKTKNPAMNGFSGNP